MFIAIGCFLVILIAAYEFYRIKFAHMVEVTKDWPSPPSLPIIGHAHHMIGKQPEQLVSLMQGFFDKYGNFVKIWIGPELNFVTSYVKDVEEVLGKNIFNKKAGEYSFLEPWLKEGLLVSDGSKWFKRRKILTPAFHFKVLEEFIEIFERQSQVFVSNLSGEIQEEEIDLYHFVNLQTLDTICGKYLQNIHFSCICRAKLHFTH